MSDHVEDHSEIRMTGRKTTSNAAPEECSHKYFSHPQLNHDTEIEHILRKQPEDVQSNSDSYLSTAKQFSDGTYYKKQTITFDSRPTKKQKQVAHAIAVSTVLAIAVLVFLLWPCSHQWMDATCTIAKVCSKCGKTEGIALGHQWERATCATPSVCSRCKENTGVALEHTWQQVTEKNFVGAKQITYSLCTVCNHRDNYLTSKLTTLLSNDEKTFLITPNELAQRIKNIFYELELNLNCSLDSKEISGIAIENDSSLCSFVWFYEGNDKDSLERFKNIDVDTKSGFSVVQLVATTDYSELDKLLTAFVMSIDPTFESNPNGAHNVVINAYTCMRENLFYGYEDLIYSMDELDGLLLLSVYVRPLVE